MNGESHWDRIGKSPHHGIMTPLFSLRTRNSLGVGEFLDLISLIDWCKAIQLDVIQLLPLNDSGSDPSPYNPLSAQALDPVYLSLCALPDAQKMGPFDLSSLAPLDKEPRYNKAVIQRGKLRWLWGYYEAVLPSLETNSLFLSFCEGQPWLKTYALFRALKDEYGGKHWHLWPQECQSPGDQLFQTYAKAIHFHSFVQFLCFSQMKTVKDYASQHKVFLKGDLPILVSSDSVATWAYPQLFDTSLQVGVPPDQYSALGQNWGFPLFNWTEHEKEGYRWWKQRLESLGSLYHLYRIDHIVGFFRLWGIPHGQSPMGGSFIPKDPSLWLEEGKKRLRICLESSPLLPIAEDLGTIPSSTRTCLQELQIPSTRVIRWERRWDKDRRFIPYEEYPSMSLTTVSTHDAPFLKGWWKLSPEEAMAFSHFKGWQFTPTLSEDALFQILQDSHRTPSFFHINPLPEYLSLFPDLSKGPLEEEQINVPGTQLPTNWTYRYSLSLEELAEKHTLSQAISSLIPKELP